MRLIKELRSVDQAQQRNTDGELLTVVARSGLRQINDNQLNSDNGHNAQLDKVLAK